MQFFASAECHITWAGYTKKEASQNIALGGTATQYVSYLKVVGRLCRLQNQGYRKLCLPSLLLNVLLPASQAGNTRNSFSCGSKRKARELRVLPSRHLRRCSVKPAIDPKSWRFSPSPWNNPSRSWMTKAEKCNNYCAMLAYYLFKRKISVKRVLYMEQNTSFSNSFESNAKNKKSVIVPALLNLRAER